MYTSVSNIEARLGRALTTEEQSYFDNVLDAQIDAYIDIETETSFASNATGDLYAYSDGTGTIIIPTMYDITSVSLVNDDDTTTLISTDEYYTYPRGTGSKYAIKNRNGTWDEDATYVISGVLGSEKVPGAIVGVATNMAINMLRNDENQYKSERVGDWSVTYSDADGSLTMPDLAVLHSYRRLSRSI